MSLTRSLLQSGQGPWQVMFSISVLQVVLCFQLSLGTGLFHPSDGRTQFKGRKGGGLCPEHTCAVLMVGLP